MMTKVTKPANGEDQNGNDLYQEDLAVGNCLNYYIGM